MEYVEKFKGGNLVEELEVSIFYDSKSSNHSCRMKICNEMQP